MMIMVMMMMIIALLVTPGSKDDDYDDINCAAEGMDVFWIIIIISFICICIHASIIIII